MQSLILLLMGVLLSVRTLAQSPAQVLDTLMTGAARAGYFNGSIAVLEKGQVVYAKSFGYANYENKTPTSNDAMYELGSIGKQFTAMAAMMLFEQGALRPEDTLRHFFPELSYHGVTIRHLLNHTSGLPDYINGMGVSLWDAEKIYTNRDAIHDLSSQKMPMRFKPGEKFEYSNTGYMILASIIEKVSGLTFDQFLRDRIFMPLGMTNSGIFARAGTRNAKNHHLTLAHGFVFNPITKTFVLPENVPQLRIVRAFAGIVGDGGIGSSLNDQIKWHQALLTEKLVKAETFKAALTPGRLTDGSPVGYGFGWFLQQDPNEGRIIQHTGGWAGVRNAVVRWLDRDRVLIILRNNEIDFRGIQVAVTHILDGKTYPMPKPSLAQAIGFVEDPTPERVRACFQQLMPDKAVMNEVELNQLGYLFSENDQLVVAVEVLKITTELFPGSWNAFDSLGEVYLKAGEKIKAREAYRRSVELNPDNQAGKKILAEIDG